jgi:hypothetical protein
VTDTEQRARPIAFGNGRYSVTEDGAVLSLGRPMKARPNLHGYLWVNLSEKGVVRARSIQSLVAEAFIGPRPPGHQVGHLNGQRQDNRADNLAYRTSAENEADKIAHGTALRGERNHQTTLRNDQIAMIRARYRKRSATDGAAAIARELGVGATAIRYIVNGKTWKSI